MKATPSPDTLPDNITLLDALDEAPEGPLHGPLRRLARAFDALTRAGHLHAAQLDLADPALPCFLLGADGGGPRLYVELFADDPDEPMDDDGWVEDGGATPVNVLANWVGSDTEPAFWQIDPGAADADAADSEATGLGQIVGQVLSMIEVP